VQRTTGSEQSTGRSDRPARGTWADLFLLAALAGLLFWLIVLARQWTGAPRPGAAIDLSPWALPGYAFLSLARGLLAYLMSLAVTLLFGYWTVKDAVAGRLFVPLLDAARRSIPVLGVMPVLVLALLAVFPGSNVGLELGALLVIFLAEFWPMTSSFRHALRSVPQEQQEMATVYHFSWWQRFRWVELPYGMMGLVWNSMLAMSRGWFVLMASESFALGNRDFQLPGIGAYLRVAVEQGRPDAVAWAIVAMAVMILLLDQLLWRPLVVWAQKFRIDEEGSEAVTSSWFLDWLRRSRVLLAADHAWYWLQRWPARLAPPRPGRPGPANLPAVVIWFARLSVLALLVPLAYGVWNLVGVLSDVSASDWALLSTAALTTLARVVLAIALGTLWAVPAGVAIGLSPRLARLTQPLVQLLASFPATLLFPLVIVWLQRLGVAQGWGSIVLLLLPAQSYILFNVIAGALTIPADLKEAVRSYHITGWQRFWVLHVPAVFPHLVRGWDAAASAAWSASVVAEYATLNQEVFQTWGVGAWISAAAHGRDFPRLAAGVLVMVLVREAFNRLVWERCYDLARERFSLNR
jgi:NitT/TauT family transport system permease protein